MNTYKMTYQRYKMYESTPMNIERFESPNDVIALIKAHPSYGGCGVLNLNLLESIGKPSEITKESLVKSIEEHNNDGNRDFLLKLEREDTGEILYQDYFYEEPDLGQIDPGMKK